MSERPALAVLGALLLSGGFAFAQNTNLIAAQQALAEGMPQIAIRKLLAALDVDHLEMADRDRATELLAAAQLADGHADQALVTIGPVVERGSSSARLLQANALLAQRRWTEARAGYHALTQQSQPPLAALLGEAECLQALERPGEAISVLEAANALAPRSHSTLRLRLASLLTETRKTKRAHAILATVKPAHPIEEKWKLYIEGRLFLLEGHADSAQAAFERMVRDPEGLTPGLLAGAALGTSDARAVLHGYDDADKPIETFLWRYPDSPFLEQVFARLDQVYAQQDKPGEDQLQRMSQKQPPRCAALAHFYVARMQMREKKPEKAAQALLSFLRLYPEHPLLPSVHLMQADLLIAQADYPAAVRALEAAERRTRSGEQRAEIQLRTGMVLFRQGQYLLAANEFRRAAERSPRLRENAAFDAALAALGQKNYERFLDEYREFTERFPGSALRGELIAEQGLTQARFGDPRSEDTLQLFLTQFPSHPRRGEAHLALAELAFLKDDPQAAGRYLKVANEVSVQPEFSEGAAYLAIFLADSQPQTDPQDTIERALDFLRRHPKSPLLPEVRMKLGQVYFRTSNFPAAQEQFSLLATENPARPEAEMALFLAGQSAMQWIDPGAVDRALPFFVEVIKRDGPLKLYAQQQQAIAQSVLHNEKDAVTLYDLILDAHPPAEPELRYAAFAGKGDNLLILGRKDPKQLEAAIDVFDQLAALPEVPAAWRNQALYKRARALDQLSRTAEALAGYYNVLEAGGPETREFFWFYKAGFDAARIFQEKQDWKSAIAIYTKMSRLEGPRAAESKQQAEQLRLKHFIWE